ncbi:MAG: prepilin-type N-terminal cleavage/methylation domain-containing protein [Phycisphaerae bacterium]|nr:prepilin-type N-terminal cleavage/methylation domain-containing protein [Phycisphaerae bacterium]
MKKRTGQKAFTLIELLIVISIIALLVSILMPALSKARQSAKSIMCLNNQRQMTMASYNYASSNNDFYPIAYYYNITPEKSSYHSWDFVTSKDWSTNPPTENIKPGILWSYDDNMEIQQCPSFKGKSNTLADPYTGYNYNTGFIGSGDLEKHPNKTAKVSMVKNPSNTALFGDGEYKDGANHYMRAPQDPGIQSDFCYAGTQGYRHNGKTNVAFCDGHGQSWQQRYTGGNENIAEGTGFLSEDNRLYDLK